MQLCTVESQQHGTCLEHCRCSVPPPSDVGMCMYVFLVPMNMLVGEFKYIIHKHINQCAQIHGMAMTHEKTIYLFVNNTAPKAGALIQEVYEAHMADDGFLYIEYSCENTLGRSGCDSCCLLPTGNYHDNLCDTTTTTTVDSRRRGCR
eukprot:GHVS01055370.1.p1 GENE.GHVS01055370.1~~GHVS01055370.1.p1  ORF type:complete len:148 (+),score=18.07 GHVS01055370.1:438-881(+)